MKSDDQHPAPAVVEPGAPAECRETKAVGQAVSRYLKRPKRTQAALKDGKVEARTGDALFGAAMLRDAFGTTSGPFSSRVMSQLVSTLRREGDTDEDALNVGLAVVSGIQPENETEAMLAVQMAATYDAAMKMLAQATQGQHAQAREMSGNLAVKLLRTYTAQMEALAKVRRGGEQTVRVEHVHVYEGGQAIVGAVTHPGGRGALENRNRDHGPTAGAADARALAFAPGSPVLREDPARHGVPVTSREGEEAVPHPRRGSRQRRAAR